jgi:gliding motility-associated peptidyl-prolyl isomerase
MKHLATLLVTALLLLSCNEPEPRRPIKARTVSFFRETVKRNKELLSKEEGFIRELIKKDTLHNYQNSASGSWFYYDIKVEGPAHTPQTDDLVTLTYNMMSLSNDTIYTAAEIGPLRYKVDRQQLFPGLRNSVKLLKEGETATFLYPSSLVYGYHGDDKKIGPNVPIKSTLSILKIEKQQDSIQN